MGVTYVTSRGTLHIVVARNPGTPYATFRDYLRDPNGLDVTREVLNSHICEYIYVDFGASSGSWVQSRRPQVQQMNREAQAETQRPPPAQPYEPVPGMTVDPVSGGVDFSSLNPDLNNRINTNSLTPSQCDVLLLLGFAYSSSQLGRRSISSAPSQEEKQKVHADSCSKLRSLVKPYNEISSLCSKITSLDLYFELSTKFGAGTYDYIQATLAGPAGKHTEPIAYDPDAGFTKTIPIDLKKAFGSAVIDLHGIHTVSLADSGAFWKAIPNGMFNDKWKVKDISLRAKCITPGFQVQNDILAKPTWYQHPTAWLWKPYTWADVATINVTQANWHMTPPCTTISKLEYEFKIADKMTAGTDDAISLAFQQGKREIALGENVSQGYTKKDTIPLVDMFGTSRVQLRDIKEIQIMEEYRTLIFSDQWLFQGISLTATCADMPKQVKLAKFEHVNKWLGDDSTKVVWTGKVLLEDWMTVRAT
ncbi:hypothetical protein RJ55_03423 [Drechmeria coniospora]|nr:hypothetical protein RJ55_03423 [Drechmeria coniospora]